MPSKKSRIENIKTEEKEDESPRVTSSRKRSDRVVVVVKGQVAVDHELDEQFRSGVHVLSEVNNVWDVMLNQTNISANSNKFYLIQLLKSDSQDKYWTWMRWGRVGYRGQSNLTCYDNRLDEAKQAFCDKFLAKTANHWSERASFEAAPRKYAMVETKFEVPAKDEECDTKYVKREPLEESKLDRRVQSLMGLITNLHKMEEDVMELEYDFSKSPLGNLTAKQIKDGYACLKEIENAINKNAFGATYRESVNKYYTCIPHDFGFRPPPFIKTKEELEKELVLLEALKNIQLSYKILRSAREKDDRRAQVDRFYAQMDCQVRPLERGNEEFEIVSKYLTGSHGMTHMFTMEIVNIYSVFKPSEHARFKDRIGNRMLLWHGSRVSNFYNILSHGLRIAPPEVPLTGFMFGKGVYFADVASKSGNYCYPSKGKCALLMLSEVALGDPEVYRDADYNADELASGKSSTFGVGKYRPNEKNYVTLKDGVKIPMGPLEDHSDDGTRYSLLYNEYVVYDVAQIRSRYLVEVMFDI